MNNAARVEQNYFLKPLFAVALALLLALPATSIAAESARPRYAPDNEEILWFLWISDTHLDPTPFTNKTADNWNWLTSKAIPAIAPAFTINTGDLTTGHDNCNSRGDDPWSFYKQNILNSGLTTSTYFDLVGNHDIAFDNGITEYAQHTMQGPANASGQYTWQVGNHVFHALNTEGTDPNFKFPPDPPPYVPGDGKCAYWWGIKDYSPSFLNSTQLSGLTAAINSNSGTGLTLAFGHSELTAGSPDILAALVGGRVNYFHGHNHGMLEYFADEPGGGIVVSRRISSLGMGFDSALLGSTHDDLGIVAIDHNLLVYKATAYVSDTARPFPLAMITAPASKHFKYMKDDQGQATVNPDRYPVCKDSSNPFRALVFVDQTNSTLKDVRLTVGTLPTIPMVPVGPTGKIYSANVSTSTLPAGEHSVTVEVRVEDPDGSDFTRTDSIISEFLAGSPCNGQCVDLSSDANNCGQCASVCSGVCSGGTCHGGILDRGAAEFPDNTEVLPPPLVVGPLFECGEAVMVKGFAPGAEIRVRVNGVEAPPVVSDAPWGVSVPVPRLGLNARVEAAQVLGGFDSGWSKPPVYAGPLPPQSQLPLPQIDLEPLYECGQAVAWQSPAGLPAKIRSSKYGNEASATPATASTWAATANMFYLALPQEPASTVQVEYSACSSPPIVGVPVEIRGKPAVLRTPRLGPAYVGSKFVDVFDVEHGARVSIKGVQNGTTVPLASGPHPGGSGVFRLQPALSPSVTGLTVGQTLCSISSPTGDEEEMSVRACNQLPPPRIAIPHHGDTFVTVTETVLGARVRVLVRTPPSQLLFEIGDSGGDTVPLKQALVAGQEVTVVQSLGTCNAALSFFMPVLP